MTNTTIRSLRSRRRRLAAALVLAGVATAATLPAVAQAATPAGAGTVATARLPQPVAKPSAPARATQRNAVRSTEPPAQPWLAGALSLPPLGALTLYAPPAGMAPRALALFASGDGGWNLGVKDMARRAAATGMWVAGFSTPAYFHALAAQPAGQCADAAATLMDTALQLKQRLGLPPTLPVVLIGYSSGATLVYAALIQSVPAGFDGALSLGFCPELEVRHAFCPGFGALATQRSALPPHWPAIVKTLRVQAPWHVLQGDIDQVCAPAYAPEFTAGVPGARAWVLPHVGHGFGYPRNWGAQYREALLGLLPTRPAAKPPRAATAASARPAPAASAGGRPWPDH